MWIFSSANWLNFGKSSPINSKYCAKLYPQNGDRIVTIDSVTSFHHMYERTRARRRPQVCAVATHHQSSALPRHGRPGSASRLTVSRYSQAVERGLRLVPGLYDGRRSYPHRSRCPSKSSGWTVSCGWASGSAARGGL